MSFAVPKGLGDNEREEVKKYVFKMFSPVSVMYTAVFRLLL